MPDERELTCEELVEIVTDYLEGKLPDGERSRFENHLSKCQGCTNYLNQMRRTIQVMGILKPEEISPEAQQALLGAFRDWKESR